MAYDFGFADGSFSADYAVEGESGGVRHPWIQANIYRPSNAKSKILLGITADSMALLADPAVLAGSVTAGSFAYSDEGETELNTFGDGVRWVILARPKVMGLVKATNDVVPLTKGMKERGEITVARLLLACVVDEDLALDADGLPQIFTLKLKSSKTAFIGSEQDKDFGQARNKGHRTIAQLNAAMVKSVKGRPGQWFGHLASVELAGFPEKFSNAAGESSWGIRFGFAEDSTAKPLPKAIQKDVFELVKSDDFKELAKNPFGRKTQKFESPEVVPAYNADEDMSF